MRLSAKRRGGALAVTTGLLAACGAIPGHFYSVQLPEAQPTSVCLDLARELSARLPLQVVDQTLPVHPKGQCIVSLDYRGHSPPEAPIVLLYDPYAHQIVIQVALHGPTDTKELAREMASIVAARFPSATITETHPKADLFGP